MANQIKIYTPTTSNRLIYSCEHIFKQLLGIDYVITDHPDPDIHINYSNSEDVAGIQLIPNGLLNEEGHEQDWKDQIKFTNWNGVNICFQTKAEEIPFDLFSAVFFHLSRYEEYLDFYPDEHYRFTARESVLAQQDVLAEPLVNQWSLKLRDILKLHSPSLSFEERKFEYLSTLDIDQAWKYRRKGFKRNMAGFFRDLLQGKWENFKERWPVYLHLKQDPFYNFEWQKLWHERLGISIKYFILLGDRSTYDKNIDWSDKAFQKLIQELDSLNYAAVGIHPSYQSNFKDDNASNDPFEAEIKRLKTITNRNIDLSRQHFLMHNFPSTYKRLHQLGIREEHTMGYSTHAGFRAGIAAPFFYYDFENEEMTYLKLVPFCLMDITPLFYMQLKIDDAISYMRDLMQKVKEVDGMFVSLWHNESLSETERWKGWRVLYEKMLEESKH